MVLHCSQTAVILQRTHCIMRGTSIVMAMRYFGRFVQVFRRQHTHHRLGTFQFQIVVVEKQQLAVSLMVLFFHRCGGDAGRCGRPGGHRRVGRRVHFKQRVLLVIVFNIAAVAIVIANVKHLGGHVSCGVSQRVPAQVAIASEDFAARRAFVRFVVGVGKKVRLQVGPLVEAATADGAFVG